jgi:hypothetical protein
MDNPKWKVISRGFGGWYAITDDCLREKLELEQYVSHAEEGALVYDCREVESELFYQHAAYDPGVDTRLSPGEVRYLVSNSYGDHKMVTEKMIDDKKYNCAWVAIDVYEKLLRKIPDIKFGRVKEGKVVWEQIEASV